AGQWCSAQCLAAQLALLGTSGGAGLRRDAITASSVVGTFEQARWPRALDAFGSMAQADVQLNDFTFTSLISAVDHWSTTLLLLESMTARSLQITPMTCSAALARACEGHWQAALALLHSMMQTHLAVSGIQVGALLESASSLGKPQMLGLLKMLKSWAKPCRQKDRSLEEHLIRPRLRSYPSFDELPIVFEDESLVAVAKPFGVSSEDCLQMLASKFPALTRLSRLDWPTSGLLLAAKGTPASETSWWFLAQFAGRLVSKRYLCLVAGDAGAVGHCEEIAKPLQVVKGTSSSSVEVLEEGEEGLAARTRITCLALYGSGGLASQPAASLLLAEPLTGRTHQLRAHLAHVGWPIVGDATYAAEGHAAEVSSWCPRLFLHCWQMDVFALNGQTMTLQADLPKVLRDALKSLKLQDGALPDEKNRCHILARGRAELSRVLQPDLLIDVQGKKVGVLLVDKSQLLNGHCTEAEDDHCILRSILLGLKKCRWCNSQDPPLNRPGLSRRPPKGSMQALRLLAHQGWSQLAVVTEDQSENHFLCNAWRGVKKAVALLRYGDENFRRGSEDAQARCTSGLLYKRQRCYATSSVLSMDGGRKRRLRAQTAHVVALGRQTQWPKALEILQQSHSEADEKLYTAVCGALERASAWQQVLRLHGRALETVQHDERFLGLACSACSKGRAWRHALSLAVETGLQRPETANALLSCLDYSGQWQLVLQILSQLPELDVVAFGCAISACARAAQWRHATALLWQSAEVADEPGDLGCSSQCLRQGPRVANGRLEDEKVPQRREIDSIVAEHLLSYVES
ncbi:Ribosomal large subunit pseudouridine synthase C (23S rRNA pseudouridine(955/2504/2580) synthase) (rRNA pseudouridylate synthase C) (rRNA-uridine isomerase C), partial [Durusdinium trenchii]